jgi:dUTP pyrophosphatase
MSKVKVMKVHPLAQIPEYATGGAAGFDFHALEDITVFPGKTVKVRTGLAFAIPSGYEIQIRPRSGLSAKTTLRVSNAPGTIDSDYRGEVLILITNTSTSSYGDVSIYAGERVAQGVLAPVTKAEFEEVGELAGTDRGESGFGSTGV